jgi:hypothetical protein
VFTPVNSYKDQCIAVMPLHVYASLQQSGAVPEGWRPRRNGTLKYPVRNLRLREYLRTLEPGRWRKVIKIGSGGEVHYREHESGSVAGVKFFPAPGPDQR